MRIFKTFILFLSTVSAQEDQLKIFTVNSDTVIKILNQKIEDDQRLSISYQLHSFNIDKNEASYIKFDSMKKIDTLIIKHSGEINTGVLGQIFHSYKTTNVGERFNAIGNTLVSKYYFINEQPSYQLGIVNDKLGAKISFEPGFESNFSGMFGMNRLDNNWILTGELNLQMENYFKSAERGEFFWRRIDSLSQTIKIGTILPHPFGWRTGVDINYQHEIFRGLYASIENRYLLSTYFPLIGTTGFGYVTGKTTPTHIGKENGYEKTSYYAFSLFSKKENLNDRYLPTSGNAMKINADGGLDGKTFFLNSGIKFLKIGQINRNIFYKISYNANGILYKGANVPKSRYHRFGGSSTLRGYDEQYFRATQFQIPSFELGYDTNRLMQLKCFMDIGSDRLNIFEKNWIGYGIGISQINEDFIINFEYGLSSNSFENGKLHLKWVTRL